MRRFLRIASLTLTVLLFLLLALFFWLQHQIKQLPVQQLDYQIQSIGWKQLQLDYLHFEIMLEQQPLNVQLQDVQLSWLWQNFRPQLQVLELQQLAMQLANFPTPTETTTADKAQWQLPQDWQWPAWLPQQTRISQLEMDLPCGSSRCLYAGSLQLTQDDNLTAQLQLQDPSQSMNEQIKVHLVYRLQQEWPELALQLSVADWLELQFDSALVQYNSTEDTSTEDALTGQATAEIMEQTQWQGELDLMVQPLPDWLLSQLDRWQFELPDSWLEQFQQPVSASSNWQFVVPAKLTQQAWQQLTGDWQLQLSSPSPMYLPTIGLLTAEIQAEAQFHQGQLAPFRLAAGGQLTELAWPEALHQSGVKPQSFYWSLSSQQSTALSLEALPLQLRLFSADQHYQLVAAFELDLLKQHAAIEQLQVKLRQNQLQIDDWKLDALQLDALLTGHLSGKALSLQSKKPIRLQAALSNAELELRVPRLEWLWQEVSLQLADIGTEQAQLQLNSQHSIHAEQLQHPLLKPLDWHWQGKLSAVQSPHQWQADSGGILELSSGLELQQKLTANSTQLQLEWQLADIFLLAGNTLATTMADWPELLTLQRGRIRHQGQLSLSLSDASWQLHSDSNLVDVSGFYDTTTFTSLSSQLLLEADTEQLQITTPGLKIEQIEQGIVAGPLSVAAQYQAYWDTLLSGRLQLLENQLGLFNGRVSLPQQSYDLSQSEWTLLLQIEQLDLQQLLTQHPTSDLTGQGLINGQVPLVLSGKGFEVVQGQLKAAEPGGKLSYRSPQAQGMAASNPGMKLIINALDDFHYTVLDTEVSYTPDGKLILALRLQGRNPSLEQGRPVHFNITLEEDIPALITSLQLTNQLNDVIQKRIQQRLQQP